MPKLVECPDCGHMHDVEACRSIAADCDCCRSIQRAEQSTYETRQLLRVLEAGPNAGEDWYRLQVHGRETSHNLNVSESQIRRIMAIFEEGE